MTGSIDTTIEISSSDERLYSVLHDTRTDLATLARVRKYIRLETELGAFVFQVIVGADARDVALNDFWRISSASLPQLQPTVLTLGSTLRVNLLDDELLHHSISKHGKWLVAEAHPTRASHSVATSRS